MRRWGRAVVVASVLLAAASCRTAVDPWQDTRIEAEVKSRLVAETGANLTRLGVVSHRAVVHLSGSVASGEQRAKAEALTRSVRGVKRVVNDLHVRADTE
jgi:osmotically-inducible protein OsmY